MFTTYLAIGISDAKMWQCNHWNNKRWQLSIHDMHTKALIKHVQIYLFTLRISIFSQRCDFPIHPLRCGRQCFTPIVTHLL